MIRIARAAMLAAALWSAAPAAAQSRGASAAFDAVLADYEAIAREANPVSAGLRGDHQALRRWADVSRAALDERNRKLVQLERRLRGIDRGSLSGGKAIDRDLLANRLRMSIAGHRFDEERIPFISGDGFFTAPDYAAFGTTIRSEAEAEAWLARLEALPAYFAANAENMRRGLSAGFTQPRLTTEKAIASIRGQLAQPAERSSLLVPLKTLPPSIPAARQEEYRKRALRAIETGVRPAQRKVLDFFEKDYLPKTRASVGISEVPEGPAYYQHLIERHTTSRMKADEIHKLGLEEVARIRAEMEAAKAQAGFEGTLPEFLLSLRNDPRFYARTVEDYTETAAEIAKRIDAVVPRYIGKLPRLTFGLRRVPPEVENTSSGYWQGDPKTGLSGSVMIHGEKVLKFPLFQLPAWVLHEGVPGHHTQIALSQELEGVSDFRRDEDITAFTEGWGLYAERLGEEMGIYRDAYERFGRLSYEAWRASRLVIDTGLHAKGWPRDRAVAYLKANTALSDLEVNNEIDRYIAWPGQALAYKIGEIAIRRLRTRAEAELGPAFDVRGFHDAVLANGPVTLDVLEAEIGRWIAERRADRPDARPSP